MSLATRCTACGTVFRVVQDQLRVSSGWVRCGRCGEVFNAIESLVDMGGTPAAGAPSAHAPQIMETLARVAAGRAPAASPASPATPFPAPPAAHPAPPVQGAVADHDDLPAIAAEAPAPMTPAARSDARIGAGDAAPDGLRAELQDRPQALAPAEALSPEPPGGDAAPAAQAANGPGVAEAATPGEAPVPFDAAAEPMPAFVRQVDRAARWRHPAVRAALALGCVAAAALLGWQAHGTHHDWLAARWPALAPVAERLCALRGCTLEPPRRLEALAVESSGLVRTDSPGTYRLTLSLRNQADMPVRPPAIDLTLSDADGRTAARRVLQASELGLQAAALAPGAEVSAAVRLRVAGSPVVGYTIEVFYP